MVDRSSLPAASVRVAWWMWSFFFQAEDGIRDGRVTGVQTCALPILVDQLVGQYMAHICGLGYLLSAEHVRTTLQSLKIGRASCRERGEQDERPDPLRRPPSAGCRPAPCSRRPSWPAWSTGRPCRPPASVWPGGCGLFFFKQKTAYEMDG